MCARQVVWSGAMGDHDTGRRAVLRIGQRADRREREKRHQKYARPRTRVPAAAVSDRQRCCN